MEIKRVTGSAAAEIEISSYEMEFISDYLRYSGVPEKYEDDGAAVMLVNTMEHLFRGWATLAELCDADARVREQANKLLSAQTGQGTGKESE